MTYIPVDGGKFYVVNGPNYQPPYYDVKGFIINIPNNTVEASFGNLTNPHDIAVNPSGTVAYVVEYKPPLLHKFEINRINSVRNIVLQKAQKQIADKATSSMGYIVLAIVVSIIILMIVSMVYVFGFRKKGNIEIFIEIVTILVIGCRF